MDIEAIMEKAKASAGPDRVYGEPFERDGLVVIPAAKVIGAGGGGGEEATTGGGDSDATPGGGGGGFVMRSRPAGALVIDPDGSVSWRVPIDPVRIVLGAQLVLVALFFFRWLTIRSQSRANMKASIAAAAIERVAHRERS
mgnify:CR=1 FL=1